MAVLIRRLAHGVVLSVVGMACGQAAETVLVLKSRELTPYSEAVTGFVETWKASGSAVRVTQQVLGSPPADAGHVLGDGRPPAAVVAVGTEAAVWAINHTAGPVVFCMIANAQQNLLTSLSDTEASRVRGVTLDIPAQVRLRALSAYVTKVKRIGVIYDPRKSGAAIQELEQAAATLGMQLVKEEVTSETALPEAIGRLAPQIDVLWAPVDSTVFNSRSAQFVLAQMLQRQVPVMGFSKNMVKAGALLALQADYGAVGGQTAQLLQAVLQSAVPVGQEIQTPQRYAVQINRHVMQLLGNPIPPHALQEVSFVNDD